jgi:hypothetical protein
MVVLPDMFTINSASWTNFDLRLYRYFDKFSIVGLAL